MTFDPEKHHRHSVRLRGYDYSQPGMYFVTVCAASGKKPFGKVEESGVALNWCGRLVSEIWLHTPKILPFVTLDDFVVMPDHLHLLFFLERQQEKHCSVGQIIGSFKSESTRRIGIERANRWPEHGAVAVWQRSFHDRIVRDERELNLKRQYIRENPQRWRARQQGEI